MSPGARAPTLCAMQTLPGTAAALLLLSVPAFANDTCKGEPALRERAKITCSEARKLALSKVGSGAVKDAELEEENGRLVYSIDVKRPKRSGIEEVQLDAVTGEVVSVKHEDPRAEAAERAADKQEAARKQRAGK